MKVAKPNATKNLRPSRNSQADEAIAVEEIDSPAESDEITTGPDLTRTPENTETVRFALTQEIEPSPRIGKFDMLHFTGKSKLEKGIHSFPKGVAEVLQDRGYGSIV